MIYVLFEQEFAEFSFYLKRDRLLYFYLKNNNLLMWANSLKQSISKTKLFIINRHQEGMCEIKRRFLSCRKSLRFLKKFLKYLSGASFKKVLKKIKKKIYLIKYYKVWISFMKTFTIKLQQL